MTAAYPHTIDHAFAAGHDDALRRAYDAHAPLIFGLCRRALPTPMAEEVTQDVFVSAWRRRDQFDPQRGNLGAWLVGIAKHRIIDHLRSERRHSDRRAELAPAGHAEPSGAASPTTDPPDVERIADQMLVADALRGLPQRPRQVIELAYIHDLTHQEIAERTGIPLGTIKSDIRRGLETIRGILEPRHG